MSSVDPRVARFRDALSHGILTERRTWAEAGLPADELVAAPEPCVREREVTCRLRRVS